MLYGDGQTYYILKLKAQHVDAFLTNAFSLSLRRIIDGFTYLQEVAGMIMKLDGFQTVKFSDFDSSRFFTLVFEFKRDTKIEHVRLFGTFGTNFLITVEDEFKNDNNDRVNVVCNKIPKLEIKNISNRKPLMGDIVKMLQRWVMYRRPGESCVNWEETKLHPSEE